MEQIIELKRQTSTDHTIATFEIDGRIYECDLDIEILNAEKEIADLDKLEKYARRDTYEKPEMNCVLNGADIYALYDGTYEPEEQQTRIHQVLSEINKAKHQYRKWINLLRRISKIYYEEKEKWSKDDVSSFFDLFKLYKEYSF